ncbi:MAG: hypothetical protein KC657_11195 [Myxococcales bacterium]|nr:hypothetical protein [Myxococcales bacterium]
MTTLASFFRSIDAVVDAFLVSVDASPTPQRADLCRLEGTLAGEPVFLTTDVFSARGYQRIAWARMATASGRDVTRTVVALPRGGCPVVGLDVVAMRDKLSLFALDLAPIDIDEWESWARLAMIDARREVPAFVPRPTPAFTEGTFSEYAMIGTVPDGALPNAGLVAAVDVALMRASAFAADDASSPEAHARLCAWLTAESSNRKEIGALGRIFGVDVATRYFGELLFRLPERPASPSMRAASGE